LVIRREGVRSEVMGGEGTFNLTGNLFSLMVNWGGCDQLFYEEVLGFSELEAL